MDSRFRPPTSSSPMQDAQLGFRKAWAVALVILCGGFPISTYNYLTASPIPLGLGLVLEAIDIATLFALYGYVRRRPIRHIGLRLLYIALALVTVARAAVVAYIAVPLLTPWTADREHLVTLLLLVGAVLGIFVARALWRYSTVPQQVRVPRPTS